MATVLGQVARAVLIESSSVAASGIAATMSQLEAKGFVVYEAGRGHSLGRVRVVVPDGWEQFAPKGEVPDSRTSDDPESGMSEVSDSGSANDPESGTAGAPNYGMAEDAESGTLTGGSSRGASTGVHHGGEAGQVQRMTQERPHPEHVLDLMCEALDAAGTPPPKSRRPPPQRGR